MLIDSDKLRQWIANDIEWKTRNIAIAHNETPHDDHGCTWHTAQRMTLYNMLTYIDALEAQATKTQDKEID